MIKIKSKTGIFSLVIVMLILMLAACQSNKEESSNTQNGKHESSEAKTRTYKDDTGKEITLPTQPKHIAAIQYIGDLLALGVKPEATTKYWLDTYPNELAGTQDIGDRPVNVEKLLSLQPDLIITDDLGDKPELEQLTKIAPTVSLKFWLNEPFAHLNSLADVLGRQKEAKTWMENYNKSAKTAKEQLKPYIQGNKTALLLIASGKDLGVSGVRNGGYTLYKQLGFMPPQKLQKLIDKDENFGFEQVSLESLADFSADYIFIELDDDSKLTKETANQLQSSNIWRNLPAVKNHQVYKVSNFWGLGDATSMKKQLDEAVQNITAK